MKYVQQVRGKWIVRITVPDELRDIVGVRELVEKDLPSDARTREKLAHGIINRFFARIDEAREVYEVRKGAPAVTLSVAAKSHYANAVAIDQAKRAAMPTVAEINAEREHPKLCVSDLGHAVFRYGQASKRPANIMAS